MNTARSRTSWDPMHVSRLGVLACVIAGCMVAPVHAQSYLPAIGGPGGGQFDAPCPSAQVLIGLRLHAADDVDAVQPICAVASSATQVEPRLTSNLWYGGRGGGPTQVVCPAGAPAVLAMTIGAEGEKTIIVNDVWLFCGRVSAQTQEVPQYPTAIFDAPTISGVKSMLPNLNPLPIGIPLPLLKLEQQRNGHFRAASYQCPAGQVAVGIHGRSGIWLDAVGLICDTPRVPLPVRPPVSLGRAHAKTALQVAQPASRIRAADRAMVSTPKSDFRGTKQAALGGIVTPNPSSPPKATPPSEEPSPASVPPSEATPLPADHPMQGESFAPPLFDDGAQLWACANAAQSAKKAGACNGVKAGEAFCKTHGHSGELQQRPDGKPAVTISAARLGMPVRARNGDVCPGASCPVIVQLGCNP